MITSLNISQAALVDSEKALSMAKIAAQVAHDIRSPLTALEMVTKDIAHLPENQRILIRNATNRINDIAINLLSQYKINNIADSNELTAQTLPELISELVHNVLSEKRAQYKSSPVIFEIDIN